MQGDGWSDAEVWRACRRGSLDAFGLLFERHHARIYRYCLRRVFVAEDAEDCLSDTYLEAWRARRSFEVEESALPMLLAIAKRVVQKHQRAGARHQQSLLRQAGLPASEATDIADDVAEASSLEGRLAWLAAVTRTLSPGDRDVYDLVMYAEMSHEQAARILGIPVGTVKSRLHRARRKIAEAADREDDSEGVLAT